jgi:hypothetical protein
MVAEGRTPDVPLAAVQAYLDHAVFGALPYAGGTFEQPAWLLEEMRVVAAHVNVQRAREHTSLMDSLKRRRR